MTKHWLWLPLAIDTLFINRRLLAAYFPFTKNPINILYHPLLPQPPKTPQKYPFVTNTLWNCYTTVRYVQLIKLSRIYALQKSHPTPSKSRMNDLLCNTCNTQCYVSTVLMHNYLLKETLLCKSIQKRKTSGPAIRQEIPRLTSIIIPYIKIKSNKKHPQK